MFHLSIATPEKVVFEADVISLTLPGAAGYMEILTNHAPIISLLQEGKVTVVTATEKHAYSISGGLFECFRNKATLLADTLNLIQ